MSEKEVVVSNRSLTFEGIFVLKDIDHLIRHSARLHSFVVEDLQESLQVTEDYKNYGLTYSITKDLGHHTTAKISVGVSAKVTPIHVLSSNRPIFAQQGSLDIQMNGLLFKLKLDHAKHAPQSFFFTSIVRKLVWAGHSQAEEILVFIEDLHKILYTHIHKKKYEVYNGK
jgi:hypothetical protein